MCLDLDMDKEYIDKDDYRMINGESFLNGRQEMHWKLKLSMSLNFDQMAKLKNIHPGEILLEEFLKPLEISQSQLARDLNVPVGRVNDIVQAKRAITPDTALRLAVYFNMTPEFWMNLQSHYDLKLAKQNLLPKIERSVRPAEKRAA